MFGFVAGGSPSPSRWGDGSDGDATWSGTSTQTGIKQYKTLTISDDAIIKVDTTGIMRNGIVIFANKEIIIGNNVEFNAQPNSNTWRGSVWTSSGADTADTYAFTGGGGGGGYGTNGTGEAGFIGNDPALYYTTSSGTAYGSLITADGTAAAGGAGGSNSSGGTGATGYSVVSTNITDNFTFTNATIDGHDDFPVVHGGDGGQGGDNDNIGGSATAGQGGTGGGMIILIAPKITFGTGVELNAYGSTRNEGGGDDCSAGDNMAGYRYGDGGSGAGGAGGGGLVSVVYWQKTGTYTANTTGGTGGCSPAGGNRGGYGGNGGNGLTLDGQRGYMAGSITWN